MTKDLTKIDRAQRAGFTIRQYGDDVEESNLIDLLADAMHWCHHNGMDFERRLRTDRMHFDHEYGASHVTCFDAYEVHGVREFDQDTTPYCEQVPDSEAEFWSLYGHIRGQGVECIGNYKTREAAAEIYARITGLIYQS